MKLDFNVTLTWIDQTHIVQYRISFLTVFYILSLVNTIDFIYGEPRKDAPYTEKPPDS